LSKPFFLVQLTDTHIGAPLGDPRADLAAAVEEINGLPDRPDAVVVTGDLAQTAADGEYQELREVLGQLDVPVYPVAGNQDDRATLRRHFEVPGAADGRIQYTADLGPLRLIVMDTVIPGELRGECTGEQLAWLDAQLTAEPERPTILAMHHPPILTLVPQWDPLGLPPGDRAALAEILRRAPQVQRIIAGHYHRTIVGVFAGVPVVTVPSTCVQAQLALDFGAGISYVHEGAAIAIHALHDGELVTHLQLVGRS
jgi:3',5'-cyclic AMP phosphodiesterase CpdA